jgi:hypothetical protein
VAGGLELATRLGDKLRRAGHHHELSYPAQAHWHHFRYHMGRMIGLDPAHREIIVGTDRPAFTGRRLRMIVAMLFRLLNYRKKSPVARNRSSRDHVPRILA